MCDNLQIIDNEIKAYLLGLYFADGASNNNQLSAMSEDVDNLRHIANSFGYPEPKEYGPYESRYSKKSYYVMLLSDEKNYITSHIGSKKEIIPELKSDLMRHFLRGVFDGNGCISLDNRYVRQHSDKESAIPGTFYILFLLKEHALFFQNLIINECNVSETAIKEIITRNGHKLYKIVWSGTNNLVSIRNFLYLNSSIFLQRKKDKFDMIKAGNRKRAAQMGQKAMREKRKIHV